MDKSTEMPRPGTMVEADGVGESAICFLEIGHLVLASLWNCPVGIIEIKGLGQPASLQVCDLTGRILKLFKQCPTFVDMHDMEAGTYIFRFSNSEATITRKVIVSGSGIN